MFMYYFLFIIGHVSKYPFGPIKMGSLADQLIGDLPTEPTTKGSVSIAGGREDEGRAGMKLCRN